MKPYAQMTDKQKQKIQIVLGNIGKHRDALRDKIERLCDFVNNSADRIRPVYLDDIEHWFDTEASNQADISQQDVEKFLNTFFYQD